MKRRKGLAFKLSMYLLAAMVLIFFALLYYNYIFSRNLALEDAKKDAGRLTELTVARIENKLSDVENLPLYMAAVIGNRDAVKMDITGKVIGKVLRDNPFVYGACAAFAPRIAGSDTVHYAPYFYAQNDTIVFKDLGAESYRYVDKAWYTGPRDLGKGVWSEPYYDEGGGETLMATYAVPFYQGHGEGRTFAGVVTADISLKDLQDLIRDIQFFDSGFGFLISSKGNVVTYPGIDSLVDQKVYNIFDQNHSPAMKSVFQKMVRGETGITSLRDMEAVRHPDNWVSYANITNTNWSLAIVFNEKELYYGIHALLARLALLGLLGFILITLMIFFISGRFVKPIEKLALATRQIGAGEFDYRIPTFRAQDEIAELGQSFTIMQEELKVYIANLKETTAQKEKIESELKIASSIQQQMLPRNWEVPGKPGIMLYGVLKPARQVGGDLYDLQVKNDFLYFAIGDVSGKGIPAALFMARTLTLFRSMVSVGKGPAELSADINHELEQDNAESMFVTFFIGKLDLTSGELIYTNAGHNQPYRLGEDDKASLINGMHGLPLGSLSGQKYGQDKLWLQKGDKIFLYTDGISEALNPSEELFGERRIVQLIEREKSLPPRALAEATIKAVEDFASGTEQADDITMLVIGFG